MRLLRFGVSFLVIGVSSLVSGGCDRCSFRNLDRQTARGTLECCGAFAVHEVVVKPGTNRQVDLANSRSPVPAGLVDLWLAPASCERLFDGPYPGSVPQCPVLIGPVVPGAVSERRDLDPGTYRVFAQSYSTNVDRPEYAGDLGIWGNDCVPVSPTAPR
jgi:hypothetical protein